MDDETVDAYLERIGAKRPERLDPAALRELHERHLLSVPFENISRTERSPFDLVEAELVDKIVHRRLGGFCYELNGTFGLLLRALGFDVTMCAGRVLLGTESGPVEWDHLCLRVDFDEPYLVDIGLGWFSRHPLRLNSTEVQTDAAGEFLIEPSENGERIVHHNGKPLYRLWPQARELEDFRESWWWHQTSPESHFTQESTCWLPTQDGRLLMLGNQLVCQKGDQWTDEFFNDDESLLAAYRQYFGLELERVPPPAVQS
ncbi:arylamine N-acetyltransferase [Lentzea sp. DG1S-22]|uniref:arylamine N-acetyltransferase family protein n=1 Tax=Lentzea sp. DG1S-22 TaxID=3108822 RepID=UPI002E7A1550|nr:arylamine N-acetyltransferase [Lentzea sp. DG1S-22]WVH82065.1 arylamine N-acetyltransferase [Lentzea sp. DG1S-22]